MNGWAMATSCHVRPVTCHASARLKAERQTTLSATSDQEAESRERSDAVLECWEQDAWFFSSLHHSTTPPLHHSTPCSLPRLSGYSTAVMATSKLDTNQKALQINLDA